MAQYKVIPFTGFNAGLNLRDSPDFVEESQSIDALNVIHSARGSVERRAGYAEFTQAELTNRGDSITAFYKADGTKQVVVGEGNKLAAINSAGAEVATAAPTASPHFFQRFGGPTAELLFIANGTDVMRQWTGAAFSSPATSGVASFKPKFLGISGRDNRLVGARFGGATAGDNPSTVRFSDEGDPLTFDTTAYVDLTPGDGEVIMGIASWRDMVIVFKQSKFFVFYGNSTDDEGLPVFNYRPVDTGVGLAASLGIAISEQGVYFIDRTGVYFTNGSEPQRVSGIVEPLFHATPSIYYQGGVLNDGSIDKCALIYHDERLYASFPSGTSAVNDRQAVFDPHENWWSLFDLPIAAAANFRVANVEELVFCYSSGEKHLGRFVEGGYSSDDMEIGGTGGTPITARWQSGWYDLNTPQVKTIREFKMAGAGIAQFAVARDYRLTPAINVQRIFSQGGAFYDEGFLYDDGNLYGPATQITLKSVRKAIRGERFSIKFSNTDGNYFRVNRLTQHVREVRVPSVVHS